MDVPSIAKGIGSGVAVAAPVGPMSVLCMRRTLSKGRQSGFHTELGLATGDAIYASIAALGLAGVSGFMLTLAVSLVRNVLGRRTRRWIDGVSSVVLSSLGVAEIRRAA